MNIKELVPVKFRTMIKKEIVWNKRKKYIKNLYHRTGKKKFVIIGTPEHGNLGDHALIYAEKVFLKNYFPQIDIVEITSKHFSAGIRHLKKIIKPEDIIFITGGGSMGSLWKWEEGQIRKVVQEFKKNKIVIFPQSIYFEEKDNFYLESLNIYNSHKNLYINVREHNSYKNFYKLLPNVNLMPDMVLYLNKNSKKLSNRSERILMCIRSDKESIVPVNEIDKIINYLKSNNYEVDFIDTVLPYDISIEDRNIKLEEIWAEFSDSKLVITDRLHGMIFSYITGTPCLAIDNVNKKVSGVYKWIEGCPYVKCISNDYFLILNTVEELLNLKNMKVNTNDVEKYFVKFSKEISERIEVELNG